MLGLRCSICHDIFIFPHATSCGHTYCQECLWQWFAMDISCPKCRLKIVAAPTALFELHELITQLSSHQHFEQEFLNSLKDRMNVVQQEGQVWKDRIAWKNRYFSRCEFCGDMLTFKQEECDGCGYHNVNYEPGFSDDDSEMGFDEISYSTDSDDDNPVSHDDEHDSDESNYDSSDVDANMDVVTRMAINPFDLLRHMEFDGVDLDYLDVIDDDRDDDAMEFFDSRVCNCQRRHGDGLDENCVCTARIVHLTNDPNQDSSEESEVLSSNGNFSQQANEYLGEVSMEDLWQCGEDATATEDSLSEPMEYIGFQAAFSYDADTGEESSTDQPTAEESQSAYDDSD